MSISRIARHGLAAALGLLVTAVLAADAPPAAPATLTPSVTPAVTPAMLTRLDGDLTPVGAERAGNAAGTIPAWTGGLPKAPMDEAVGYRDPYAGDAVLHTITAANAEQFRAQLSDGHRAMLQRHPGFKMNVYPTRRSASWPDEVLAEVKRQAPHSRSAGYNLLEVGRSAVPFPFTREPLQMIWNHQLRWRGGSVSRPVTWFPVAASGRNFKSLVFERTVFDQQGYMNGEDSGLLFSQFGFYIRPARNEGGMSLILEPIDPVARSRATWSYEPFFRRVIRSPSEGYDFINPLTDGLRVSDQYDGFNGAPDRFEWKLLGRREMYIGYNAFKLSSRELKYNDILNPGHVNPELLRYELHRVWVIEATLRPDAVHRYPKRIFYLDEDTWQVSMEEIYDSDGTLWRFGDHQQMQFYDAQVPWYRATIFNDLRLGAYLVTFLDNEERLPRRWGWKGDPAEFLPGFMRIQAVR